MELAKEVEKEQALLIQQRSIIPSPGESQLTPRNIWVTLNRDARFRLYDEDLEKEWIRHVEPEWLRVLGLLKQQRSVIPFRGQTLPALKDIWIRLYLHEARLVKKWAKKVDFAMAW
jgi:hypothetical protein